MPHGGEDEGLLLPDPQSPTSAARVATGLGGGALDLQGYSAAAALSLHTVTPPRRAMDELAAEVQGTLRMLRF